VLPEPTTKAAVNAAAAPILAAEQAARDAEANRNQNADQIRAKAEQAIDANIAYLAHAAVPAGTLTTAQLSNIVRSLTDQLDGATRQLVALERLAVNKTDGTSGT
jgi:azurin